MSLGLGTGLHLRYTAMFFEEPPFFPPLVDGRPDILASICVSSVLIEEENFKIFPRMFKNEACSGTARRETDDQAKSKALP